MADRHFTDRFVPKWIAVTIDTMIVLLAFLFTRLLINDFSLKSLLQSDMSYQLPILMAAYWAGFMIFKPFNLLSGSTGLREIGVIFYSVFSGALIIFISNLLINTFTSGKINLFSLSSLLINVSVTLYMMTLSRLIIRYIFKLIHKEVISKPPVQQNQLTNSSLAGYPVELLVFNALN
jgi:hypothetical protein